MRMLRARDRTAVSSVGGLATCPTPSVASSLATSAPALDKGRSRISSLDIASSARLLIRGFDRYLSRHYGVRAFSNDPRCLLRLAPASAAGTLQLSDGTAIIAGESIVDLHLWSEHIPPVPPSGPNLAWGRSVYECLDFSMRELARALRADPNFSRVRACRAQTNFTGPGCPTEAVTRLIERSGFEDVDEGPVSLGTRIHDGFENLLIAALVWTHNPAALCRRKFRRVRRPVWISREHLFARYPDP